MRLSDLAKTPRRLLDWFCAGHPDYDAHRARQRKPGYRNRKTLCTGTWIAAGVVMLAKPAAPVIVTCVLLATFLSFAILDGPAE